MPPKYQPKPPDILAERWVCDPFSKLLRVAHPVKGFLVHTPAGCCVEVLGWLIENNKHNDPVFKPAIAALCETLETFLPDLLQEVLLCPLPSSQTSTFPPPLSSTNQTNDRH